MSEERKVTYVVYEGDEVLCVGTDEECARALGVRPETVSFYASPAHKRRVRQREGVTNGTYRVAERCEL